MSTSNKNIRTDYLRIGLRVESQLHQFLIIKNLKNIAYNLVNNDFGTRNQILHPKYGYDNYLRLPLFSSFNYETHNEETPHLAIKCNYLYGGRRFILIEFKGHSYDAEHWLCCGFWLRKIFGKKLLEEYWPQMLITNIHLAFNFDTSINNLLFNKTLTRKSALYFNGHGEIETIYFQPKNRKNETCIYDRKAKMKNRNLTVSPETNFRAEVRLGKLSMPFDELLKKPESLIKTFNRIQAFDLQRLKEANIFHRDTLLAIKLGGIKAYRQQLPSKHEKELFNKKIKPHLNSLINMDFIRDSYRTEVDHIKIICPLIMRKHKKYKKVKKKFEQLYIY